MQGELRAWETELAFHIETTRALPGAEVSEQKRQKENQINPIIMQIRSGSLFWSWDFPGLDGATKGLGEVTARPSLTVLSGEMEVQLSLGNSQGRELELQGATGATGGPCQCPSSLLQRLC